MQLAHDVPAVVFAPESDSRMEDRGDVVVDVWATEDG